MEAYARQLHASGDPKWRAAYDAAVKMRAEADKFDAEFGLKVREADRHQADSSRLADKQSREVRIEDAKARQATEAAVTSLTNLQALTREMIGSSGLNQASGVIQSRLPTVFQSTANFEAALDNLKNRVAIEAMQALKAASATGATGFGALSEKELAALQNSIASLDLRQDPKTLKRRLEEIDAQISRMSINIARGYSGAYGQPAPGAINPGAPAGAPMPAGQGGGPWDKYR